VGGRCGEVELSKRPPRLVVFDAWTDEVSRGESKGALKGLVVKILGRDWYSSAQRGRKSKASNVGTILLNSQLGMRRGALPEVA